MINEIISGISTLTFTIGTYLVNMGLENKPSLDDYSKICPTVEAFEIELSNIEALVREFFEIGILQMFDILFSFFLPIVGVTVVSIIIIVVKI